MHKYLEPHDIYNLLQENITLIRDFSHDLKGNLLKSVVGKYQSIIL
jgi:hypothetical protein